MKTAGIVLAGGLSRRFGSPKAFARFDSGIFMNEQSKRLESFCEEVIVVTREELLERFPQSVNTITDLPEVAGLGPLAGIYSAMETVDADAYVVLPCDMPYVDYSIMNGVRQLHKGSVTASWRRVNIIRSYRFGIKKRRTLILRCAPKRTA